MWIDTGKCIREAQELKGITNTQMAEDFGVARQQIHRWRTSTSMHLSKAHEFADYFGIDVFDFLVLGETEYKE